MDFLRRNWLVLVFIGALVAAPIYAHADSVHQAKAQLAIVRRAAVERCIASSPRAAYAIAFQYQAGQARAATGNIITAKRYNALGDAAIRTVAAPAGYQGSKALVQVRYRELPNGRFVAELTERARALQKLGCEQAYSTRDPSDS